MNKVLRLMEIYYQDKEKARQWYERPNQYFSLFGKPKASPKEMVESGHEDKVLKWIKITIER